MKKKPPEVQLADRIEEEMRELGKQEKMLREELNELYAKENDLNRYHRKPWTKRRLHKRTRQNQIRAELEEITRKITGCVGALALVLCPYYERTHIGVTDCGARWSDDY